MKIKVTNKLGLPQAIVHAVSNDSYDAGETTDFSATGLLKPARMAQLMKSAEVTEDAADRIYSLQGQVMHYILERAGKELRSEGFIVERRFYLDFEVDGTKYRVSAQIDIFDPKKGILSDYKYTSVGAAKHGLKEDHRLQLNLQAELLRNGFYLDENKQPVTPNFKPTQAEVVLLLRDWSAERSYEGYPESPAVKQVVQFMTSEEVRAWVASRIRAHVAARSSLPLCSGEERWNRPTFAVMKSLTSARATRTFPTRAEAEAFIADKGQGQIIVERPGEDVRCRRYCPVRSICTQAQEALKSSSPEVGEDGFYKVS